MRFLGIDVGTGNLASAEISGDKQELELRRVRDAFFKIDLAAFMAGTAAGFGENMLKTSGAHYVKLDHTLYILGEDAFKFANLFHKECLRPMAKGVLNPDEPAAAIMLRELIRGLVGNPQAATDCVYFCVPAAPIDAQYDIIYHTSVVKEIIKEIGYQDVSVMNEGLAVVYSELQNEGFSGVGLSLGAGLANVCYSFLGIPIFSFSICRSGDYLDEQVAKAVNETKSSVQAAKEAGIDMLNPKNNIDKAYSAYYENLIEYIINQFIRLYATADKKSLPNITEPMTLAVAGGTSLAGGFTGLLEDKIRTSNFPVPIGKLVQSKDPLIAIAKGLCNAALVSKKK